VAVLGLVAAMATSFLHDGLSSRATPTALEKAIARKARHLAILRMRGWQQTRC